MRFFSWDRGLRLQLQKYWLFAMAWGVAVGVGACLWDCQQVVPAGCAALALGGALALLFGVWRQFLAVLLLFLCGVGLGITRAHAGLKALTDDPLQSWPGAEIALRGYIAEGPKSRKKGMSALVVAEQAAAISPNPKAELVWRSLHHKTLIWLTWPGSSGPELRERVEMRGQLKAIVGKGGFADYCRQRGIHWRLHTSGLRQLSAWPSVSGYFWQSIGSMRVYLKNAALTSLPRENACLFIAMALGDTSRLGDELLAKLRFVGVAHVLAASGLHVGLLLGAIFALVRLFGYSRRCGVGLAGIAMFIYAALAGFTPSIVRAVLMAALSLLGLACGRPTVLGRSWAAALTVSLCVNPLQLYDAGFQLSYAAVGGIVLWQGQLNRLSAELLDRRGWWLGWLWKYAQSSFVLTAAVSLTVWPLLIFHFGQFSLLTFLANLLILPLLELALGAGLTACLVEWLGLGWPWWRGCEMLEEIALWEANKLQSCPLLWSCPDFPAAGVLVYYGLLLAVWLCLFFSPKFRLKLSGEQ
ncbi:MAG: ComEC/Rec2 family competence protein [bacterium]|nr:ComEC/Rec2 family competence protein [bacterium]